MSKVVHLSNAAHQRAKDFCQIKGLRMSDWVADLIANAIAADSASERPGLGIVGRRPLRRLEESRSHQEEAVPVYAQPPFWSRAR